MVSLSNKYAPTVEQVAVLPQSVGQRLDNFLFRHLKGVPKTRVYRIVRRGEVRVNKGRVKPDYRLLEGDIVRIPPLRRSLPSEVDQTSLMRAGNQLEPYILYEDESILVLNKPAGLASHGGSGLSFGVIELLRQMRPKIERLELAHRIDRDTSGCLIIAKDRKTLRIIQDQMVKGEVEKIYLTLVKGQWHGGQKVEAPLIKNHLQSGERMVKVHPEGQKACTEFKILERYTRSTLLEAKLITGRTHQIRVHTAYVGNPIAGDSKYGDQTFNREMKMKGLQRMFLHAKEITLKINEKAKPITFTAPLDEELLKLLNTEGKNYE